MAKAAAELEKNPYPALLVHTHPEWLVSTWGVAWIPLEETVSLISDRLHLSPSGGKRSNGGNLSMVVGAIILCF